jgi:hypothetical protein
MEERYVAFDVETPNAQNRRMSAIGVSVIERGEIVQELYTLVDPQTHFDPFNIALTGITPEQVDGVYLAGGFGSYLDPESAIAIGMLPRACAGKLHTLGNTALAGAAALTLDPAQWQRIGNISRACDYLELSGRADFAAAFTDDLSFPQP